MNMLTPSQALPGVQEIRFPDFEVSFAGAIGDNDFCFGSEDGKVLFTDEQGEPLGQPQQASASGEAINGIAASGDWLAITTRAEVNFVIEPSINTGSARKAVVPVGSHGVSVAPSGRFVIPLGHTGITFVSPSAGSEDRILITTTDKEGFSFYRLVALSGRNGDDLIVCAGRRGGIGISEFRDDLGCFGLNTVSFAGLDAVDVCSIATPTFPRAVAGLSRDGAVILIRDVLSDNVPMGIRFDSVIGTAYRILGAGGDIFLLTSNAMYVLSKLALRFLIGDSLNSMTPVLTLPMKAADANLVRDRWLLAVLPEKVHKFDLDLMAQTAPLLNGAIELAQLQPRTLTPDWEQQATGLASTL